MRRDENLLFCLSGGKSVALISLIETLNNWKQPAVKLVYIDEEIVGNCVDLPGLTEYCNVFGYTLYVEPLELPGEVVEKLHTLDTSKLQQVVEIARMQQLMKITKKFDSKVLILGESHTRIATKSITDISQGKGWNIPLKVSSEHDFHDGIWIVRPFSEFDSKTLAAWSHHQKIPNFKKMNMNTMTKSMENIVESFLLSLQSNYSGATSNIVRTLEKLEKEPLRHCLKCENCGGIKERDDGKVWLSRHVVSSLEEIGREVSEEVVEQGTNQSTPYCFACLELMKSYQ